MNSSIVDTLKANLRKKVTIIAEKNGVRETITAFVLMVDERDGVAYELIDTDRPERYQEMGVKIPGSFFTPLEFIVEVKPLEEDSDSFPFSEPVPEAVSQSMPYRATLSPARKAARRQLLLGTLLVLEVFLLSGAVNPPRPESLRLARLSMLEATAPSEANRAEIQKERARLRRQQEFFRAGFILAAALNGAAILALHRRRQRDADGANES